MITTPFQLMETVVQIQEAAKDRWLSEEEINFFFKKLDCYDFNKTFLLKLRQCVQQGNFLPLEFDDDDTSGNLASVNKNLIQRIKNALKEILWKKFNKNVLYCIEKDSTLTEKNKEYMRSLTETVIIKAKRYGHEVLHQIKGQQPSLFLFLSNLLFFENKKSG